MSSKPLQSAKDIHHHHNKHYHHHHLHTHHHHQHHRRILQGLHRRPELHGAGMVLQNKCSFHLYVPSSWKRVLHRLQCHVSATSQDYLVFRQLQHCVILLLQPPRLPDCTHASKWSRSLRSIQSSELHCSSNDAMSAASCLQMSARVYCSRISLRSI